MARLIPGTWVRWNEQRYICAELRPDGFAVLRDAHGDFYARAISELSPTDEWAADPGELVAVDSPEYRRALNMIQVIKPLVFEYGKGRIPHAKRVAACEALECSMSTLYRHINEFRASEKINSFYRIPRSDAGISRLGSEVDAIVEEKILTVYLKMNPRKDINILWEEIDTACRKHHLKSPSLATINRRVGKLPAREVVSKRLGRDAAKNRFDVIRGSFPGAEAPWMVYQIDHTPIDLQFVDEVERKNIGRGFLTIVIDVCTRMIAGFCISLDDPSVLTTGIALGNAILTKETWLEARRIKDLNWPIFGVPAKVHTDNAKEFVGTDLARSCDIYGINIEQRPKGQPQYGGHVERAFRTFMRRTHSIPGTTYSDIDERGDYDSESHAIMSLSEYERWFAIFIVGHYHNKPHGGLRKQLGYNISPLQMFNRMVLGTEEHAGCGYQTPITDEYQVRLDFLPFEDITIQKDGVVWDRIQYQDHVLNPFIGMKGPDGKGKKFRFVRDPRDVSVIYFWNEETRRYFPVSWIHVGLKPLSKWEWNKMKKGNHTVDAGALLRAREQMQAIVDESARKTTSARRQQARTASHRQDSVPAKQQPRPPAQKKVPLDSVYDPFPVDDE